MDQEAEKEINFESLRAIVEEAIKNKDTSAIEAIEDEGQLRYMQKYTESLISKDEFWISSYGLFAGVMGLCVAFFAIGVSFILTGASVPKELLIIPGVIMIGFGGWAMLKTNKAYKAFEKREKETKFMHTIVLKIEEKLIKKIPPAVS